ncbi:TPA: hypothetical protein QDB01_000378 [Burkholderia vietnamiensis]|nr:hypothetical protein [Burkholderia vietnamiensis]
MTQPLNTSFRPHVISCWVDTPTIAPISGCSEEHTLPIGTAVRIVVIGVLANNDLLADVIAEIENAKRIAKEGRTQIGAAVDENTKLAMDTIGRRNGASRAQVLRAALRVGAKHLGDFSAELASECEARSAAHRRSRDRLIKMMNRFQDEVSA